MFQKGNQFAKGNPPNKTSFKKGQISWNKEMKGFRHSGSFKIGHKQFPNAHSFERGHPKPKNAYSWPKGYHPPNEIKKGELVKEKNPAWRGGISLLPYPFDWTDDLKDSIRKRDNYMCQECSIHQDELSELRNKKLDVHHIDYCKDNLNPNNLITLCRKCHIKTNNNRDYWIDYFQKNKNYEELN